MQLVLLTFVIGVLNLCLGYALAVHWGYGPPTLWDAWDALSARRPAAGIPIVRIATADNVLRELEQAATSAPQEPLPAEAEEVPDPVVEAELDEVELLRQSVDKAAASLAKFAARLKKGRAGQSGKTAWNFVSELQEICTPYVRQLGQAAERVCDAGQDASPATALGEEVEKMILEQAAQLETTLSNLQYMDFESGFSAAMTRLQADAANTLTAAQRLQECLEGVSGEPLEVACQALPA